MINAIFRNGSFLLKKNQTTNHLYSSLNISRSLNNNNNNNSYSFRYFCTLNQQLSSQTPPSSQFTVIETSSNNESVEQQTNQNNKKNETQFRNKKSSNRNNKYQKKEIENKERIQNVLSPLSTTYSKKPYSQPFSDENLPEIVPFDQATSDLYTNLYKNEKLGEHFKNHIKNNNIEQLVKEITSISSEAQYWLAISMISIIVENKPQERKLEDKQNGKYNNNNSGNHYDINKQTDTEYSKLVLAVTRYSMELKKGRKTDPLHKIYFNFNQIEFRKSQHEILMDKVRYLDDQPTSDEHLQSMLNAIKMLSMDTVFLYDYLSTQSSSNFIRTFFNNDHLQWTSNVIQVGIKDRSHRIEERLRNSADLSKELEAIIGNEKDSHYLDMPSFIVHSELMANYDIVELAEKAMSSNWENTSKLTNSIILYYLLIDRYEMALHWYSRRLSLGLVPNHFTIFPFIIYHEYRDDGLLQHWESVLDQYPIDKKRRDNFRREFKFTFIMLSRRVFTNPGVRAEVKDVERETLEKMIKLGRYNKTVDILNSFFDRGLFPSGTALIQAAHKLAGLPNWQQYIQTTPDFVRCLLFSPRVYEANLRDKNLQIAWEHLKSERPALVYSNIVILNSILCGLLNNNELQLALRITIEMTKKKMKVYEWIHRKISDKSIELGYFDEEYYKFMPGLFKEYRALFRFKQMAANDHKAAYSYMRSVNVSAKIKSFLSIAFQLYEKLHGPLSSSTDYAHLVSFFSEINYLNFYSVFFQSIAKNGLTQLAVTAINSDIQFFENASNLSNHQMVSDALIALAANPTNESQNLQVKLFKTFMSGEKPITNIYLINIYHTISQLNNSILHDNEITQQLQSLDLSYKPQKLSPQLLKDIENTILDSISRNQS